MTLCTESCFVPTIQNIYHSVDGLRNSLSNLTLICIDHVLEAQIVLKKLRMAIEDFVVSRVNFKNVDYLQNSGASLLRLTGLSRQEENGQSVTRKPSDQISLKPSVTIALLPLKKCGCIYVATGATLLYQSFNSTISANVSHFQKILTAKADKLQGGSFDYLLFL